MYTKIIIPSNNTGTAHYDNAGSSAQTVNYLAREEKDKSLTLQSFSDGAGGEVSFFDQEADIIAKAPAIVVIDNNVKGLTKDEEKFTSLIINPSEKELKHIGNDHGKLREFTRKTMKEYAANFDLKRDVQPEDLVWVATIHRERQFKAFDKEVKSGNFAEGDLKPGLNTHIHVTVSNRNASMNQTLNPVRCKRKTFDRKAYYLGVEQVFDRTFKYKRAGDEKLSFGRKGELTPGEKELFKIDRVLERVETNHAIYVDRELVKELAMGRSFDGRVGGRVAYLERKLNEGSEVEDPEKFIRDIKEPKKERGLAIKEDILNDKQLDELLDAFKSDHSHVMADDDQNTMIRKKAKRRGLKR